MSPICHRIRKGSPTMANENHTRPGYTHSMKKGSPTKGAARKTQRRTVDKPRDLPQATLRWIEDAGRAGRTIPAELRKLALTVKK